MRLLVVEDDLALQRQLVEALSANGYAVDIASDGREALYLGQEQEYDAVILDVGLPLMDGISVLRKWRAEQRTMPVLILTARDDWHDKVSGIDAGADDYVTKPFSVRVLLERIKALHRRKTAKIDENNDIITRCGITLDRRRYRVTVIDKPVELTKSEFRLLDTLIRQPGRAFDRSELIDSALGEDTLVLERTIDVHIRALRKKIGPEADAIETVRGVGYRFRED